MANVLRVLHYSKSFILQKNEFCDGSVFYYFNSAIFEGNHARVTRSYTPNPNQENVHQDSII